MQFLVLVIFQLTGEFGKRAHPNTLSWSKRSGHEQSITLLPRHVEFIDKNLLYTVTRLIFLRVALTEVNRIDEWSALHSTSTAQIRFSRNPFPHFFSFLNFIVMGVKPGITLYVKRTKFSTFAAMVVRLTVMMLGTDGNVVLGITPFTSYLLHVA